MVAKGQGGGQIKQERQNKDDPCKGVMGTGRWVFITLLSLLLCMFEFLHNKNASERNKIQNINKSQLNGRGLGVQFSGLYSLFLH